MSLDLVLMGYVANAFGVKGHIKVKLQTEQFDSILDYPKLYLGKSEDSVKPYEVEAAVATGDDLNLKLVGVKTRDEAYALKGYSIYVPRSDFPELEDDSEYYWVDLIGCKVSNLTGDDFGVVTKLIETGANDVLVIDNGEVETLIPFVEQYVSKVEIESKKITVDWGLDY